MNVFVDIHGRVDKPISSISFENVLRTEEIKKEQQILVKEACPSVLTTKKEVVSHVSHDPMACYMENIYSLNLQLMMSCEIKNKKDNKSMSVLDMDCFTPEVSFQLELSFDSKGCYSKQFQQIFPSFDENRQGKSPENKKAVEEMIQDCSFTHVLEDPFVVLLETMNSPNIFKFLRFRFICNFSNELLMKRLWSEHVQSRQDNG
jgi:hypothetical protein